MILRLTCPMCNRDAYNSSVESFKPCPYCGILFSGKYGTSRRGEARINKEIPLVFSRNGHFVKASTINISETGLCVKIYGGLPLSPGDILNISVNASDYKAQVVWAYGNAGTFVTVMGLKVLDGKLNFL